MYGTILLIALFIIGIILLVSSSRIKYLSNLDNNCKNSLKIKHCSKITWVISLILIISSVTMLAMSRVCDCSLENIMWKMQKGVALFLFCLGILLIKLGAMIQFEANNIPDCKGISMFTPMIWSSGLLLLSGSISYFILYVKRKSKRFKKLRV